jgi:hypothetical protein
MDPLQRFGEYAADFEKTFKDDDWTRLEAYFDEDATYIVSGSSYDCEIRGRDAILSALKKALDGFDRRFGRREITPGGDPVTTADSVVFSAICRYEKQGLNPLSFSLSETAKFDESGRIVRLRDDYPAGQHEMTQWLEENSVEFDPSYE